MGQGTELGRVRGLGSAKEGAHHWWQQRVTAAANLFLMVWFVIAIARLSAYDYDTVKVWLSSAWVAIPMLLLILSVFWHFRLGLQVVIEDYLHHESKVAAIFALNFFVIATAAIAVFSILKVAFTAGAHV
ncbi:succinate dehydrogenase, hydrophobic membrane anchor protein [Sphingomonas immobilis]|uniref:Succinate dehydrogenase hydrophobic membrane anchor subunit n=1 Tax=Sphingomonas immobilis TaxID=3063997 RepID=A0ABT9A0D4_9SPHN|nr:succinate dehydrogenase, hydrophobic membrane anchor protein [Sphingomonas sp. CA1-15]MDO7843299.1 succinate dehydrogenase, hydrophobic membrane anchor protein [Sphingomonas sp. CA1-15]